MQARKSRGLGSRQRKGPNQVSQKLHRETLSNCSALRPLGLTPPDEDRAVFFWAVLSKRRIFKVINCRVYIEIRPRFGKSQWFEVVADSHRELAELIAAIIRPADMRRLERQADHEADRLREQAYSFRDLATWCRTHRLRGGRKAKQKAVAAAEPAAQIPPAEASAYMAHGVP